MAKKNDPIVANNYSGENIQVLEGREAVRKRPGMYIGDVNNRGLHQLVYEVVDNSIDEGVAGYCTEITVTIHQNNAISVKDNGRGIPTDLHPQQKKSTLEVVMTILHAGGKFDKNTYKVSGGLHGVGVSCVNFLSENCKVRVEREGKIFEQAYKKGIPVAAVKEIGTSDQTGTLVYFEPDQSIFTVQTYNYNTIADRLRELAFLNPGIRLVLIDLRNVDAAGSVQQESFYSEEGLNEFVTYLEGNKEMLIPAPLHAKENIEDIFVEIAMSYNTHFAENIISYVNNINTIEGGTHVAGFRRALTRTLKAYADKSGLLEKAKIGLSGENFREGLTAIIHVKIPEPQFEGQTKTKLGNTGVLGAVDKAVGRLLDTFLEENPRIAQAIIKKAILAAQANQAAQKARELIQKPKNSLGSSILPGKLAPCIDKDPANCEIYIVEGDSAGGTAKQGRDGNTQAILAIKGKILNIEKAQPYKMYENEQIRNIITALRVNFITDEEGQRINLEKLRYHRIIIMTDADVDGSHICTLLLTFFFRYMKELIQKGYIYIAQPPLFLVKQGKEKRYCWTEKERLEIVKGFEERSKLPIVTQRYKGLGEMNADQLWDTTLNPEVRRIKQVSITSAVEAERIFSVLMGEEVMPRKLFITQYAKKANIDA